MSALINPSNVVFAKGYLFATRQGGTTDDIPFGIIQNCSLNSQFSLEELMSPSQLTAVGVGVKEHKVTVDAEMAAIRARQLYAFRGGTLATASGKTTLAIGVNDEPVTFDLHFKTPLDGSDVDIKVYGLVCASYDLKFALNNFTIPKFQANAYGNGTNIVLVTYPGDQTTS